MAAPATKAIVFDCFGVLYTDSKLSLLESVPIERRQELRDVYQANDYGYMSRHELLTKVAEITGMSEKEVESYINHEHKLNASLADYIVKSLKPTYKIGLLSNIGRDWMQDFFDTHALHDHFDAVVLSGEEGIAKPHPRIYEIMAERLGVSPGDCVMIDDIEANCAGADAAGMKAIHFTDNSSLISQIKMLA